MVMSFHPESLKQIGGLRPQWDRFQSFMFQPRRQQILDGVPLLAVHKRGVRRVFVGRTQRRGLGVYAFTMNDPFGILAMVSRGVDGIITDRPAFAAGLLEARECLSPLGRFLVAVGSEAGMATIFM